jgi:hypothetical protein
MEKKKNLFEKLKQIREEGFIGANVPTNSMASGKIAGSVEAGDDPPVRRKRKKYIYQKGLRKIWKP